MSAFTGVLTIQEHDADTENWSLVSPLVWEIGFLGSGEYVTVTPGFVCDGASIPWPVSVVFPHWGRRYRRPAVLHDWLCRQIDIGLPEPCAPGRRQADWIFLEAMAACNVFLPIRWLFYLAVRAAAIVQGKP